MNVFNIGDNALMYSVCFPTNLVSVLNCFQVNLQTFDTVVVFGVQEMVSKPVTCTLYVYPGLNVIKFHFAFQMETLREKCETELEPSTQVIACRFPIQKWTPSAKYGHGPHSVWQYHMSKCKEN